MAEGDFEPGEQIPWSSVRAMAAKRLGMTSPVIVQTGIERENLFFEALRTVNREEKEQALLELLRTEPGSGIVHAATVRRVDELYAWLQQQGFDVERYHGRMSKGARVRYCEILDCRTQYLREYFGEPRGSACEHCDNCRQPVRVVESAA